MARSLKNIWQGLLDKTDLDERLGFTKPKTPLSPQRLPLQQRRQQRLQRIQSEPTTKFNIDRGITDFRKNIQRQFLPVERKTGKPILTGTKRKRVDPTKTLREVTDSGGVPKKTEKQKQFQELFSFIPTFQNTQGEQPLKIGKTTIPANVMRLGRMLDFANPDAALKPLFSKGIKSKPLKIKSKPSKPSDFAIGSNQFVKKSKQALSDLVKSRKTIERKLVNALKRGDDVTELRNQKNFINQQIESITSNNQLAGAGAGIEPQYDEQGNLTGVGYDPTKGLMGVGAMAGIKKVKGADDILGQATYLKDKWNLSKIEFDDVISALSGKDKGGAKLSLKQIEKVIGDRVVRKADQVLAKDEVIKPLFKAAPKLENINKTWKTRKVDDVFTEGQQVTDSIFTRARNKGFNDDVFIDAIEAQGRGVKPPPEIESEVRELGELFESFKQLRKDKFGDEIGDIAGYFHRTTGQGIENVNRGFGQTLVDAGFIQTRTGKLKNYIKSPEAVYSYMKQALGGDLSKVEIQKVNIANKAIKKAKDLANTTTAKVTGSKPNVNIVDMLKDLPDIENTKVYKGKPKSGLTTGMENIFTSTSTRAERAGKQFYDDFMLPFKRAQKNTGEYLDSFKGLTDEQVANSYRLSFGNPEGMKRSDMIQKMVLTEGKALKAQAIDEFTNNAQYADFEQGWQKDLANEIFDEFVLSKTIQKTALNKINGMIRGLTGRSAIGLNVSSALNNLLETKRVFASISNKAYKPMMQRVMRGESLIDKYYLNPKMSTALERTEGFKKGVGKVLEKYDDALFKMFDKTEGWKDNMMLIGFEEQGKLKGLTGEALENFVIKKFDQYAVKYGTGQDIGLFKNDVMKTLFQFGQYAIKDLEIALSTMAGLRKGGKWDRGNASYLAKYIVMSALQVAMFQKAMGVIGFGNKTGTPLDFIEELTTEGFQFAPIVNLMKDLVIGDQDPEGEGSAFDESARQKRVRRSVLTLSGFPSNQLIFKTGLQSVLNNNRIDELLPDGYLEARKRGYYETYAGNVAGPVGTTPEATAKGVLFGPSYDPARQEYIDRSKEGLRPSLTKKESEVFKLADEPTRKSLYKGFQIKRDEAKEIKTAKADMREAEEGEKKVGDKVLYLKKKTDTIGTYDLTDPDQVKSYNYARMTNGDIEEGYEEDGWVYHKTKSGNNTRTETKLTVDPPELTGSALLDKQIMQDYKGAISSKENDILKLFELGKLSEEEAVAALEALAQSGRGYGVGVKKPKKTSISRKKISIKTPKFAISGGGGKRFKLASGRKLKKFKFA